LKAHHRNHDPEQLARNFPGVRAAAAESQHGPGEGERQGEDRMLELDHFERQPETFPEHRESSTILPPAIG
jgi:hypothetical protein